MASLPFATDEGSPFYLTTRKLRIKYVPLVHRGHNGLHFGFNPILSLFTYFYFLLSHFFVYFNSLYVRLPDIKAENLVA